MSGLRWARVKPGLTRPPIVVLLIRLVFAATLLFTLGFGLSSWIAAGTPDTPIFVACGFALLGLALTHVTDLVLYLELLIVPAALQIVYSIFIFLAMFFGELFRFYDIFFWWDIMLHFGSGAMFGIVGYLLFFSLNRDSAARQGLHPAIPLLFAFCFSLSCELVWEVFEFTADRLLGTNMQCWHSPLPPEEWAALQNVSNLSNPGLIDTMKDIINNLIGTLISLPFLLPLGRRSGLLEKPGDSKKN